MKRLSLALVALLVGLMAVPLIASPSNADGLDGLVTAEAESFALRVEYDIPLPAGPGTAPHTVGEIRRTTAGENAKGLAGAPTHFDAVVLGEYINPNHEFEDPKNYNSPPQVECFYPGDLVNTAFGFPTDTRDQTKALPPISHATAQCGAGPITNLDAAADELTGVGVSAHNLESTSLMHTINGFDSSETSAHASAIDIAGGAVTIGGVDISSTSRVTGKKGGASTRTRISVNDVSVGGVQFSIADDRLIVGNTTVPLVGNAAQAIIDQANSGLESRGCRVDVIDNPGRYPQGYLFARPSPKIGLAEDGSFAASMRTGLLIVCDLPESVTPENLSPERVQVVVGFAYSSASATRDPGGFGLGNLGGDTSPDLGGFAIPASSSLTGDLPSLSAAPDIPTDAGPPTQTRRPTLNTITKQPRFIAVTPLDSATRTTLLIVCLIVWALLTHFGINRLRRTP